MTLDNIIDVRITEDTSNMRTPELLHQKSRQLISPQFYVNAGLISWQPFIRQNDKILEAFVEIESMKSTSIVFIFQAIE